MVQFLGGTSIVQPEVHADRTICGSDEECIVFAESMVTFEGKGLAADLLSADVFQGRPALLHDNFLLTTTGNQLVIARATMGRTLQNKRMDLASPCAQVYKIYSHDGQIFLYSRSQNWQRRVFPTGYVVHVQADLSGSAVKGSTGDLSWLQGQVSDLSLGPIGPETSSRKESH